MFKEERKIYTKQDLQEVYEDRLAVIDKQIPSDFVSKVFAVDPSLNYNRVQNVRHGRCADLYILEILEGIVKEETK